jgi:hypothetical protein
MLQPKYNIIFSVDATVTTIKLETSSALDQTLLEMNLKNTLGADIPISSITNREFNINIPDTYDATEVIESTNQVLKDMGIEKILYKQGLMIPNSKGEIAFPTVEADSFEELEQKCFELLNVDPDTIF